MLDDKKSRSPETVKRITGGFILVAALTVAVIVGALGTAFAWTRATRATLVVHYTQSAQLTYTAQPGQASVYGSRGLKTGQPIYLSTLSDVTMTYTYVLRSSSVAVINGTEQLVASINNGEGVTRSIQLQPPTAFRGTGFSAPVTLPVSQLADIAHTFEKGGVTTGLYSVTIRPAVKVKGNLVGKHFTARFDEPVHFVFGNGMLAPTTSAGVPAPGSKITASIPSSSPDFNPSVTGKVLVPNGKTALLAGLPVKILRVAAPVLLVLAAAAAVLTFRRLKQMLLSLDEGGRIALRHGSSIVEVDALPADTRLVVVGLGSFDGVARIARQLECPILHLRNGMGGDYVVIDNGTIYRYRVRSLPTRRVGRVRASSGEPGRHVAFGHDEGSARFRASAGE